jgi:DHA2 family multidrug resistance protein
MRFRGVFLLCIDRQLRTNENRPLAVAAKRLEANAWRPRANPWVIAITVTLATFKEVLDSSIANVAMPISAARSRPVACESVSVSTGYPIANAMVLTISGWIANRMGRKHFYLTCVALITFTSLLCGLAPTLGVLVLCRVLHGTADGGLQPSEQSVLIDTLSPKKHSMAFAVYTPDWLQSTSRTSWARRAN